MLVSKRWVNEKGKYCREFQGRTYRRFKTVRGYLNQQGGGHNYLHRDLWEVRNGPIPYKFAVVPVDGDWEDFSEENWICRPHGDNRGSKRPMIEFNGEKYYQVKRGYYERKLPKSFFLHRAVWAHHNGPIPKGAVIHHIDGDKGNNDLENLQMFVSSAEHIAYHHKQGIHNHTDYT